MAAALDTAGGLKMSSERVEPLWEDRRLSGNFSLAKQLRRGVEVLKVISAFHS